MAGEITLEQALQQVEVLAKEKAALIAEKADLQATIDKVTKESADEIEALKLEIEAVKEQNAGLTKEVPGFYVHKAKGKSEVKYRFKKGRFHVVLDGQRIAAKDALQDSKIMEKLIELGSGSIEIFE